MGTVSVVQALSFRALSIATDGAIRLAHKIYAEDPERYYMPNQYANPANVQAHYETTGPEIWAGVCHDGKGRGDPAFSIVR